MSKRAATFARWTAASALCVAAAAAWPAAVTAHDGPHGPGSHGALAERQGEGASPSATQPTPTPSPVAHGAARNAATVQSLAQIGAVAHTHAAVHVSGGGRETSSEAGHSEKETHASVAAEAKNNSSGSGTGATGGEGASGPNTSTSAVNVPATVPTPNSTSAASASHASASRSSSHSSSSNAGSGSAAGSSPHSTPSSATPVSAPASATPTAIAPTVTGSSPEGTTLGHRAAHRRAVRGAHARRGSAHARAAGSGGAAAPVSGTVAAGAAVAGAHATAARGAHRGTHTATHGSASGLTPAIRTVERIANVVPRGVWIMMGLLGALSGLLAAGSWFSSSRARRLERQRGYLAEEVGLLQAALLPAIPARFGAVGTSVAYRPAEGPAAGGDFYDLFALEDGRLAVIVGDVSGHGPAALPQTALIRYTLRTYLDAGLQPRAALHAAAVTLDHQLDGSFATVVLASYDPSDRTLTYACAGHPPPLVITDEPLDTVLSGAAPPIGVGLPTGTRQTILKLPPGAAVCFFTDGIVEARIGGELFGTHRLTETLTSLGPSASAEALLERVVQTTDRRPDDMAACLLRLDAAAELNETRPSMNGHGHAPVLQREELEIDKAALAGQRIPRFLAACGLSASRVAAAMRAARLVVGSAGEAVLRLRVDGDDPEVEVVPHNTGVLHLAQRPGPSKEAQLVNSR